MNTFLENYCYQSICVEHLSTHGELYAFSVLNFSWCPWNALNEYFRGFWCISSIYLNFIIIIIANVRRIPLRLMNKNSCFFFVNILCSPNTNNFDNSGAEYKKYANFWPNPSFFLHHSEITHGSFDVPCNECLICVESAWIYVCWKKVNFSNVLWYKKQIRRRKEGMIHSTHRINRWSSPHPYHQSIFVYNFMRNWWHACVNLNAILYIPLSLRCRLVVLVQLNYWWIENWIFDKSYYFFYGIKKLLQFLEI